jgi:hypothetical protein
MDGDVLTYSATLSDGSALPSWLSFDVNTQTFSGTPSYEDAGVLSLKVMATDPAGESAEQVFSVDVVDVNRAPQAVVPVEPNQSVEEGQPFSYQLPVDAFVDMDGDVLSYSATLSDGSALPSWLSFDANTQTFSGTPSYDDAGVLSLKVMATDPAGESAEQVFSVDVVDVNRAPQAVVPVESNQSVEEGQPFSYQLPVDAFVDMDGDVLSYSATLSDGSALPSWLSFDANTQTFSGTPSYEDAGVLSLKVMATDPAGESAEQVFSVDVVDVNDAPQAVVPVEPNQSVEEGQPFSYQLPVDAFVDMDGDVLTYSATLSDGSALPSWLSFDANTQTFSGTPSYEDAGVLSLKVMATDPAGESAEQVFSVDVVDVNRAPQAVVPVEPNQSVEEGQPFSYQLPVDAFVDMDGDVLTYSATLSDGSALPSWLSFDANTQTFSGTPSYEDAGVLSLKVMATDPAGESAEQVFSVDVVDVNRAPQAVVPVEPNQSVEEGQPFSYQLPVDAFVDMDGDVLSYSATLSDGSALPSWLSFDAATQTFSGTPSYDDANVLTVKVTATDPAGLFAEQVFSLDVIDVNHAPQAVVPVESNHVPQNHAPEVKTDIADTSVNENQVFTYQLPVDAFIDLDNDTLSYTATLADGSALPSWLSFNANTQTFSGTPSYEDAGVLSLKVMATDPAGESAEQVFSVDVVDVNRAPQAVVPVEPNQSVEEGQPFSYQLPVDAFVDMDGDVLSYSATLSDGSALPSWLSFDANTQTFSGTPSYEDAGVLSLKVMATDPAGESAEQVFSVDVVDVNRAPQAVVPVEPNQSVEEGQPFSYQLPVDAFVDMDGDVLSYSATLSDGSALPSWLSFNAATQTFSGTPSYDDAEVLAVKVTATDPAGLFAEQVFSVDVIDVPQNHAPEVKTDIADTSVNENQVFTYQLPVDAFIDLDNDTLSYTATLADGSALPSWLSFNANTQTFSGTPSYEDAGVLSLKVMATDPAGESAEQVFSVDVVDVNRAPQAVVPVEPNQSVEEGQPFSYQLPVDAFVDMDGDVLSYSATLSDGSALPSWLSFNANTQTFSGTPSYEDAGVLSLKVMATDPAGESAEQVFSVDVVDVNRAPQAVVPVEPNQSVEEGQPFSYQLPVDAFVDMDGDVLSYSATLSDGSALPSWLSFNAATQTFSGTPSYDDAEVLAVKVTATDPAGLFAEQVFSVDVIDVPQNHAPEVKTDIADTSVNENQVFTYQLPVDAFIDLDNDTLSYTATLADGSALLSWLSFDAATQTFSGTPSYDDANVLTVKVVASDGQLTAEQVFTLDVIDVNRAPEAVVPVDNQEAFVIRRSRWFNQAQLRRCLQLSITCRCVY